MSSRITYFKTKKKVKNTFCRACWFVTYINKKIHCHCVSNAGLEFAFYCMTMLSKADPRRIYKNLQLFHHKLKRDPQDSGPAICQDSYYVALANESRIIQNETILCVKENFQA